MGGWNERVVEALESMAAADGSPAQAGEAAAAIAPSSVSPAASVTTTTSAWDSGGDNEIAIPDGSVYADVYVSADAYLVPSASADDPAQNGCRYVGPGTYRIPVRGQAYLHIKRAGDANVTVEPTFFAEA
jgi:hypothetical protein